MKRIVLTILIQLFCIIIYGQVFLAEMKNDYKSTCSNHFIIKKSDLIVVFRPQEITNIWSGYNIYGEIGCFDTVAFHIIPDRPIFKYKSNSEIIKHLACSELIKEEFSSINVDYCSIVNRIINKDLKALTAFFDLIPKADGSLAETLLGQTWDIINLFSDTEFSSWLKTLDDQRLKQFVHYLTTEIEDRYDAYIKQLYPESWIVLKKFK